MEPMTAASQMPADLTIHPRNLRFQSTMPANRWWLGGDPVATALYNSLSVTFPEGEKFFIDAVAHYRDRTPEPLRSQITAFARQEGAHTREHMTFNNHVTKAGYDLSAMDARTEARTDFGRTRWSLPRLGATAALEHFTAILAHEALVRPEHFDGAPDEIRRMWRWHAIEEIEHKAVAFDTFLVAAAKLPAIRRWIMRCLLMFGVTIQFARSITANVADFLRQDGIEPKTMRRRALRYLFGEPGMLKHVLPAYFAYYRPGFHPWNRDDRALIAGVDAELATQVAA